ncbi:MAG: glycosyltransferase [Desulfobacteraceae bacterium]|jgi:glycosyltransferase involved in cell wall biosynthesis|nr:glycosyltransferase [Desulfobacteraceae bacterium]
MKILHISKYYPPEPGGIENFVYDLANAQIKQGHDVYVLSHQTDFAKPSQYETINGVKIVRVRTFGQLAYAPITPEFILRLRSTINRFNPDIIHAHLPNISAFWLFFLQKTCPLILHWHADVVASKIDRKMSYLYNFYKPWETRLLNKANSIICTSDTYLKHSTALRQWHKKCHVIPLGLDPDRINLDDNFQKRDKKNSPLTVLSVGRFAYYKGFEYLIAAAEKLPDIRFIIIGDGPGYAAIKERVTEKGLQNRIFLPGKVSGTKLIRLFQQCDIFCLPSLERTEAFGLVLLEAMYFGKPLITTLIKGSGVNEVNQHGYMGLQVPTANAEALAKAIEYLKTNADIRMEMGRQAQKRFKRCYHIQSVAEDIMRLY